MMAAAAEHLADGERADQIIDLMERLAIADVSEAAFERAAFGHVLAETAMRRCDLAAFDRVLAFTDAPGALRYAVWRTRMEGGMGDVMLRLEGAPEDARAMHVRQVIDGLADVLQRKTCATPNRKSLSVNELADSDNTSFYLLNKTQKFPFSARLVTSHKDARVLMRR